MSKELFKLNISFNEALKRTAEYNPKDKNKINDLEDNNKIKNKEIDNKTKKPPQ